MTITSDWQVELGGLLTGAGTAYRLQRLDHEKPEAMVQDQRRPRADGRRFGVDFLDGTVLNLEYLVTGETPAEVMDNLASLRAVWQGDAVRRQPGEVMTFAYQRPGSPVRRVFGRPRRFTPATLMNVGVGSIAVVADFHAVDHLFYDDELHSLPISGVPIQHRNAVNLVRNPSFEVDTSEWVPSGCTIVDSDVYAQSGTRSMEITPDGGVDASADHFSVPVAPGIAYTLSGYVFTPATLSTALRLRVVWFDSGGGFLSLATLDQVTDATAPVRLSGSTVAPTGATTASFTVDYDDPPLVGDVAYVDAVMFVQSPEPIGYFDGDDDSAFWTGTPHASTSRLLSGGVVVPVVPPVTLSETFTESTVATNGGTAATWPVFTIRGPRHRPRVRFVGGGVEFWLDLTLARDQRVIVDTRPWSRGVRRNDGANLAGAMRGTRLSGITLPSGDTEIAFRGEDPAGLSSLTVQWRDAHTSL